jgi:hypothetical protein
MAKTNAIDLTLQLPRAPGVGGTPRGQLLSPFWGLDPHQL